ncbi:MAG TPA: MFS transporter [Myxococcota bacterium]|nr:MFS transporter [Myxococcota bacterium]
MNAFFAASFVAFGVVLVLPGAHQADLARALGLDLARSGLLASALAAGLGVGVVLAGPLFDRFPRRPLFVASLCIAAAALLSVREQMSFAAWLLHVAAAGFGIGLYDTLINAAVAERYGESAARPMSLLHAGATIGAMSGPFLAAAFVANGSFLASFRVVGAAHLALALWASRLSFPHPPLSHLQLADAPHVPRGATRLAASVAPFALIAFAYVGVEASLTIFAVPYATSALGLSAARGASAISAFWLGLLAGRVGVLALPVTLGPRTLGASGALAACALLLGVATRHGVVELTFFATGVALGCVYPLIMALVGERVRHARGVAAGLAAGAGALGGTAVPWLTGALGDAQGVAAGVGSLAVWCAAIALSAALARGVR